MNNKFRQIGRDISDDNPPKPNPDEPNPEGEKGTPGGPTSPWGMHEDR